MNYVLSAAQMRELDRKTIEELGIPSLVLMETAGKSIAESIFKDIDKFFFLRTTVICGKGNNGGDGAVIARWLKIWGHAVRIVRVGIGNPSPDAQLNFDLCAKLEIPIFHYENETQLDEMLEFAVDSALIVDAVFGTGFNGELDDFYLNFFVAINEHVLMRVAVDMPSWVNADTGFTPLEIPIRTTYAIGAYKFGHFAGFGKQWCGNVKLIDIGIPREYFDQLNPAQLITVDSYEYPERLNFAHKGTYGRVTIFGGCLGYTGASVMAANSALRAGAGLVLVFCRMETTDIYANKLTEAIYYEIGENEKDRLPAKKDLLKALEGTDCILIGPGLGLDDFALKALTIVLEKCTCTVILDADAITLICENPVLYRHLENKNVLLIPHWGEFSRVSGFTIEEISTNIMGCLSRFVKKYHARVLLKSFTTIYHDEEKTCFNITGNDGLATGGSGDVLAGIIASFVAQGMEIPEAAINASYLMGDTARMLAEKRATPSILPRDIIENLFVYEHEDKD
ncbi:MAG: NAD(P)H-hydrate dehydratase [Candidatus Cloacimonadaceae bacterium]|nr:NAD(P)H-hydrate dehydratase [Candidatus Cloacimonadaceae bacterium]